MLFPDLPIDFQNTALFQKNRREFEITQNKFQHSVRSGARMKNEPTAVWCMSEPYPRNI
jgi:hypothetical protein